MILPLINFQTWWLNPWSRAMDVLGNLKDNKLSGLDDICLAFLTHKAESM